MPTSFKTDPQQPLARARHGVKRPQAKRTCGACTRLRTPCQCKAIRTKRGALRCRLHGGLSTGPKTPEGRARVQQAIIKYWAGVRAVRQADREKSNPTEKQMP